MKFVLAFILLFIPIFGAEGSDGFVVLSRGTIHEGDYFVTGGNVEISGTVTGDVYAFGSHIAIDGTIEGDVIGSGGTIEISGDVKGSVRLAAGQIDIDGVIGRNLTAMGGNIQLDSQSVVQGNVILTGGVIDLTGIVKGDATLTSSSARILGSVGGNVKAYINQMRLGPRADVGGNFEYSSSENARMDPGAEVKGEVTYHPSAVRGFFQGKWKKGIVYGSKITGTLMNFLFSFVIGWFFIKVFPRKMQGALRVLQHTPWKAFWVGLLTIVAVPIACIILFITILGFPLALALLAVGLLGFYTAKIFPIMWLANYLFPKFNLKKNSLWLLALGLVIFFVVVQVPFLGSVVSMALTLLGLGSLVLGRMKKNKAINSNR